MTRTMLIIATVATSLVTLTSAANASFSDANNAEDFVRAEVGLDIVYKMHNTNKKKLIKAMNAGRGGYHPNPHGGPTITTWDKIGSGTGKRK